MQTDRQSRQLVTRHRLDLFLAFAIGLAPLGECSAAVVDKNPREAEETFFIPKQDLGGLKQNTDFKPGLPNVLLIGDSISIGYTNPVIELLKDVANVQHAPASAGDTVAGLRGLSRQLGTSKWDVIHFNWGLWDLCYRNPESKEQGNRDKVHGTQAVPLAQYERNLEAIVQRLEKTGAKLIWGSTTAVPEGEAGRFVGDDVKYNDAARRIMEAHNIPINDLHALSVSFGGKFSSGKGDVHFKKEGSAKLAEQVALTIRPIAESQTRPPTPLELWKNFDPDHGDFKEEIVQEETTDGVYSRDSYISAYVNGQEVRVFCKYAVKVGAQNAPGLLNVHGWMGAPSIDRDYVQKGWAELSFDYCGKKGDRTQFTKYPTALDYGRMEGTSIKARLPNGEDITDPKQTSHYLWFAIQRRALSYLIAQKEVDPNRVGAKGFSYGGTLMWNLGMDARVRAVVAYFGIGWNVYYRDKAAWMYNVPYHEPPKTPGEKLYLATVESQAHARYITAATLWLNGSNDHHGGHERGDQTFKMFKPGVPWSFAIQARGHHNTEKLGDDCKLWLEKYVLGRDIAWPARPKSELVLGSDGVPELRVTPAATDRITEVQIFEAQKEPNNIARSWRDAPVVREGNTWIAKLPVLNVDDYVFSYANIRYANNIVISSDFNAAIPAKLGHAVATDKKTDTISEGVGNWTDVGAAEGVGGVEGFRPLNNAQGTKNDQFGDPKWKAPAMATLTFRFYCTEPQKLTLVADGRYQAALDITASDQWQRLVVPAGKLTNRQNKQPMPDWSRVNEVQLKPQQGSDITKVIFAQFKWATGSALQP